MNKDKVISMCHKISREKNIPFNSILTYYFLENILYYLSRSKYKDNFIYKGGYLLSNIIGISERTTVDIDLMVRNISLEKTNIKNIFEEILVDQSTSNVKYSIYDINDIRNENDYGGYRIRIECRLDNIKQIVPFDISAGDVITYQPMDYKYRPLFYEDEIDIIAYNLETILSEKLETIFSRGFLNTRMKDYYDIYIISKLKSDEINLVKLKDACVRTFSQRNTNLDYQEIGQLLFLLQDDKTFSDRWNSFIKMNKYLGIIKFEEVISEIIELVESMK